jgi:TfoX/Sxy family transcriptional regulator of competence genes
MQQTTEASLHHPIDEQKVVASEMNTLEQRIEDQLKGVPHISKRMFGGLCFMVRGNMLLGTFRDSMMVRVSKDNHDSICRQPGATAMEMRGKVMVGYILVSADALNDDKTMKKWVDLALAHNQTLPEKSLKKPAEKPVKKR